MTSWKPSNCAETMLISPSVSLMALARQGRRQATSRRERWRAGSNGAIARLGQVAGIARIAGYAVETCTGTADHQQMRHADSQAGVAYRRAGTRAAEVHPVMRAKPYAKHGRTEGAEPSFNEIVDVSDDMRRRRGRRRETVAMRVSAALLIVISICIRGFPVMLQYRSAHELSNTSDQSARAVAGWPYPQADDAIAAAKEYNKRLAASGRPILGEAQDPFSQVQGSSRSSESGSNESDSASAKDTEYQSLLDSGSGVMGTIRIPKISVKLPIYHGTSQSALASGSGASVWQQPAGGRARSTHAVITGHRGLVDAMMFTRLDEMRVGDYFYIEVMGRPRPATGWTAFP